jgi:peptidoglycan/xylan/chitin deacetylase (PgdA/CDA1 family)
MLRQVKFLVLSVVRTLGGGRLVAESRWRRQRLPIFCYHGFSLRDEHRWNPALFVTGRQFDRRLAALARGRYCVLPLGEALERLRAETLPPRAVAITVDDGLYDFAAVAFPILARFGMHATVFASTYYVVHQRPVFTVMASYLLWRGSENGVGKVRLPGSGLDLPVGSRAEAVGAENEVYRLAEEERWSTEDKHACLGEIASAVGEDWGGLQRDRVLGLMNPAEIRELDPAVADVQLHTHRHRMPHDRELILGELRENRSALAACGLDPARLVHFCYPSGVHDPEFLPWLREAGVISATTCEPGLASRSDDPLLLPRIIDTTDTPEVEFASWASGLRAVLNRRTLGL